VRSEVPPVIRSTTVRWSSSPAGRTAASSAEVEDGDPVRYPEDVVHVVRDHDDGDATVGEPADQVEDHLGLRHTQCGGRLVHDHQPGVPEDRLGDRHRLALATRQRADRLPDGADRRDRQLAQGAVRGPFHARLVQESAARALTAQEHVLDDVEVVAQREVLVDDLDPERRGVPGAVQLDGLTLPQDPPGIRPVDACDALDQHGLPGPVVTGQRRDQPRRHLQRDVGEHLDRAEALVDVLEAEQWIGHHAPLSGFPFGDLTLARRTPRQQSPTASTQRANGPAPNTDLPGPLQGSRELLSRSGLLENLLRHGPLG
jgi:hypothetical protein